MEFMGLFLDKSKKRPLYLQLYDFLAHEIRTGRLAAGERLPGKRSTAEQLGISLNTVNEAYQMLAGEGYLQAKARSGFVVNDLGSLVPPPSGTLQTETFLSEKTAKISEYRYNFLSGGMDSDLFPRKMWNRLSKEVLANQADLFARGESGGDLILRHSIADYLRNFRGVRCTPQQLVMGAGLEVLLGLLAPLLPQGKIALENPGYAKTARLFQNVNRESVALDVDEQGLPPQKWKESAAPVAYLTPSHQFPTGFVMPMPRRAELLRIAAESGGFLIEDDYDSEFRFSGHPLPSLQGMDEHGRVVYAGTFSRSLAPGIRASYLVLPPDLLRAWHRHYDGYSCTIWRPEQHTLAHFISEGHFARQLNRVRLFYRQRLKHILELFKESLPPNSYRTLNTHTGLYFILRLQNINAQAVAEAAQEHSIAIRALSQHKQTASDTFSLWDGGKDALVLGYGGLPKDELTTAVHALQALLFT